VLAHGFLICRIKVRVLVSIPSNTSRIYWLEFCWLPDNERWLHQPQAAAELQEAMTWAQNNPPIDRKSGAVLEKLRGKG
jgi:hypothetical protein